MAKVAVRIAGVLLQSKHLVRRVSVASCLCREDSESVRIKAREWRFRKNEQLRKNRHNSYLEKRARNGQLLIPLNEIHTEWKDNYGNRQLQTLGLHSNIYQDVFGSVFYPRGFLNIHYGPGESRQSVEQGNLIEAEKTVEEPAVSLPRDLNEKDGFASLVMTDPDGHLTNGTMELLHWMIVNIPCGETVTAGTVMTPYLQPVPPRGSGFHRYVFSLFTHAHPLSETAPTRSAEQSDWLEQRTFSTREFLTTNCDLKPYTFAHFQSHWDQSVHDVYMRVLAHPEPVYSLKAQLTPRRTRQTLVQRQRAAKYSVM